MFCCAGSETEEHKRMLKPRDIAYIFEIIDDNNKEYFKLFFEEFKSQIPQVLKSLDSDSKNLLHRSCEEGRIDITMWLIEMFIENGLSLTTRDNTGSTPLDLACIRGYNRIEDMIDEKRPMPDGVTICSYRFHIVSMLLAAKDKDGNRLVTIKRGELPSKINCPLHWAIYWGDYHLAKILIQECPKQLFFENRADQIPFDMATEGPNDIISRKAIFVVELLLDMVYDLLIASDMEMLNFNKILTLDSNGTLALFRDQANTKFSHLLREKQKQDNENQQNDKQALMSNIIVKLGFDENKGASKKKFLDLMADRLQKNRAQISKFPANQEFEVFTETTILQLSRFDKLTYYVQRIINWFAYFERGSHLLNLIKKFKINPFMLNPSGYSMVHVLVTQDRDALLTYMITCQFKYINSSAKFDIKKAINIATAKFLDSPLHLAATYNCQSCFKTIFSRDLGDPFQLNQRCLQAIQLIPKSKSDMEKGFRQDYWDTVRETIEQRMHDDLLTNNKFFEDMTNDYSRLTSIEMDHDYCLVISGDTKNYEDSLIYKQLLQINLELKDIDPRCYLDIQVFPGYSNRDTKSTENRLKVIRESAIIRANYFIILIKPSDALYSQKADELNFKVYNSKKGFRQVYISGNNSDGKFEPFKDYEKQMIITTLLNEEFNIKKYVAQGFVLDYFPLHEFKERKEINSDIYTYFANVIVDPLVPGYDPIVLVPLTELGLYHGLQNGYYFGFLSTLTTYMLPLGLTGLTFHLFSDIFLEGVRNHLVVILAVFIAIWSSFFMEGFKRREQELAFLYDALDYEANEEQREEFSGNYVVNDTTKKVVKENPFTTFQRRIFLEGPSLIIAACMVLGSYYIVFALQTFGEKEIEKGNDQFGLYISLSAGLVNSLLSIISTIIYSFVISFAVDLENHSSDLEMNNSIVLKTMFFRYISSFFTLVVLTVTKDGTFQQISSIILSSTISASVLNVLLFNIMPYVTFKLKKFWFYWSWTTYMRQQREENYKRSFGVEIIPSTSSPDIMTMEKFKQLPAGVQTSYIKREKELIFMEQVELSRRMVDFAPVLDGYYATIALQFGYITFFGIFFPVGLFLLFIANSIMMILSAFAYSDHVKRSKSKETNGIGIWKDVFVMVGYAGVIYNALVIIFLSNGFIPFFGNENNTRDMIIVLVAEHVLLCFKALIGSIIDDQPQWVEQRIIKETFLVERYQEKVINMYKDTKESRGSKTYAAEFGETPNPGFKGAIIFDRSAASKVRGGKRKDTFKKSSEVMNGNDSNNFMGVNGNGLQNSNLNFMGQGNEQKPLLGNDSRQTPYYDVEPMGRKESKAPNQQEDQGIKQFKAQGQLTKPPLRGKIFVI